MEDKELYEKLLGVKELWNVIDLMVDMQKACVTVKLGRPFKPGFSKNYTRVRNKSI